MISSKRSFPFFLVLYVVCFLPAARAQLTNVSADQAAPIPRMGHDYIHLLSETVNPADGSVSMRLNVPMPKGRALTVPFAFAYDSNGVHYIQGGLGQTFWRNNTAVLSLGGWTYTTPLLTTVQAANGTGIYRCFYWTDYLFQDPQGGRHALGLSNLSPTAGCSNNPQVTVTSGGDDIYAAMTPTPTGPSTSVVDRDGTVFQFCCLTDGGGANLAASSIEDRNGNVIKIAGNASALSYADTLGRTLLSYSGFGTTGNTVTVSGLSTPYTITWGTAPSNFTVGSKDERSLVCTFQGSDSETQSVIRAITLPNGKQYTFSYDSDNPSNTHPFGLLTQISYPSGGWVKYVWGFNPLSMEVNFPDSQGNADVCDYLYDSFAIVSRTVSFDGTHVALTQNFTYSTTWNSPSAGPSGWSSKQTTVTTTDQIRGGTFQTIYTYVPQYVGSNDPNNPFSVGPALPLEKTTTYKDWNGAILKTVTKTWQDQFLLTDETVQLGTGSTAPTSDTHYTYYPKAQGFQLQEKDGYDYGSGAKGPLLRKTIINYASFPVTPIYPSAPSIFDQPSSIITYDGNSNRVGETDFAYDQSAVASVSNLPTGTHDETHYGASSGAPRGERCNRDKAMFSQTASWTPLSNTIGRLSEAYTQSAVLVGTLFSYDSMGRVTQNNQCAPVECPSGGVPLTYSYDFAGNMLTSTDPIAGPISYKYHSAGRPTTITTSGTTYPATLATVDAAAGYYPGGEVRKITLGNGLTETSSYNSRLQPCRYNTNSSGSMLGACADSIPSGSLQDFNYGFNSGTSDNGNLVSLTATGTQSFNRNFSYDQLNRLSTLSQSTGNTNVCSSSFGLSWTYDPWANRTDQTVTGGTCNAFHASVNPQNQLVDLVGGAYKYDSAGNMIADGSHTYTYDAENRLIQVDGTPGNCSTGATCYVYDALGRRVHKTLSNSDTLDYVYDLGGNVLGEWQVLSSPIYNWWGRSYVYLQGQLLARYGCSTTFFFHKDHLGSTRLMSAMDESIFASLDYLPLGELASSSSSACVTSHEFTGKERDSESGLDNFGGRYDSSSIGRFMSPDPLGGRLIDPQTLNKYSYVRNNPVNLIDPTGLYTCKDDPKDGSSHCASDQDKAFEKARQQDLKSKDPDVVRAAKAYGDRNTDNGVGVQFGDPGKGNNGITSNNVRVDPNDPTQTKLQAEETVTIRSGLSGAGLAETVGHEGSHVADAQDFVATIDIKTGGADQSKNLTKYATELAAYLVSQSILASANEKRIFGDCGVNPCILGTGILPAQVRDTINRLLANPNGYGVTPDKPGTVMYPNLTTPK